MRKREVHTQQRTCGGHALVLRARSLATKLLQQPRIKRKAHADRDHHYREDQLAAPAFLPSSRACIPRDVPAANMRIESRGRSRGHSGRAAHTHRLDPLWWIDCPAFCVNTEWPPLRILRGLARIAAVHDVGACGAVGGLIALAVVRPLAVWTWRRRWAVCAICGICSSGTVLCCTPYNTHRYSTRAKSRQLCTAKSKPSSRRADGHAGSGVS
jgi:hypothetical protein